MGLPHTRPIAFRTCFVDSRFCNTAILYCSQRLSSWLISFLSALACQRGWNLILSYSLNQPRVPFCLLWEIPPLSCTLGSYITVTRIKRNTNLPQGCHRRWKLCRCVQCSLCRVQSQSRQCAPENQVRYSLASSPCGKKGRRETQTSAEWFDFLLFLITNSKPFCQWFLTENFWNWLLWFIVLQRLISKVSFVVLMCKTETHLLVQTHNLEVKLT